MSLSTLKPLTCRIHTAAGENYSQSKSSTVYMMNKQTPPPLQVKEREQPRLRENLSATSRREMMQLTAASAGILSLLLPASAEARPRNANIRQKIMEKFEELRAKAGLSKTKDEGQEKEPKYDAESNLKKQDEAKEMKPKDGKKHTTALENYAVPPTGEPSIPALPSIINDKVVETTLP